MIKTDVAGRKMASFGRTHKKQFQVLLGVVAGAVVFFYYQLSFSDNTGPSGEFVWEALLLPLMLFGGAIAKIIFDIFQDMPYLCFREDHFFLEGEKGEKKYYWRDVEDIKEVTLMDKGMPRADKVVLVVFKDESQIEIDPRSINFAGADVGAIAHEFWQSALTKIG